MTPTTYITPTVFENPGQKTAAGLAFVKQERIFWIDPAGSIYALSDSAGIYSEPVVSQDGLLVAFLKLRQDLSTNDRQLFDVMLASSAQAFEPRSLASGVADHLVSFSPNGQWLLTRRLNPSRTSQFFEFGLHVLNTVSGQDIEAAGPAIGKDGALHMPAEAWWAPDSIHIFYDTIARCGMCTPDSALGVTDVFKLDAHGILDPGQSGALVFSPDGSRLLVLGQEQAVVLTLAEVYGAGGPITPLPVMRYGRAVEDPLRFALPEGHWVDNGTKIRLAVPSTLAGERLLQVWEIPAGGQAVQTASFSGIETLNNPDPYPHTMLHGLWNLNASRMAINLDIKTKAGARSDIALADGKGQNTVAFMHNARFLNWSPDGLHFIFMIPREGENGDLMTPSQAVYLGRADNAGAFLPVLPGSSAEIDPRSVRWLDASTYVFQTFEVGGQVLEWRGLVDGPSLSLD
jgi:hypothetical protein